MQAAQSNRSRLEETQGQLLRLLKSTSGQKNFPNGSGRSISECRLLLVPQTKKAAPIGKRPAKVQLNAILAVSPEETSAVEADVSEVLSMANTDANNDDAVIDVTEAIKYTE